MDGTSLVCLSRFAIVTTGLSADDDQSQTVVSGDVTSMLPFLLVTALVLQNV